MGDLSTQALAFYADRIRSGATDLYAAHRVHEQHFRLDDGVDLLRLANVQLIEHDPWFLAGGHVFLHGFSQEELERMTPFVGAGLSPSIAALLRARLWYWGGAGPFHAPVTQLARSLEYLEQVPLEERAHDWHEMNAGCLRVVDLGRYEAAFAELDRRTDPEWRAQNLLLFLRTVARAKDWAAFDRWRPAWSALPPSASRCNCYFNELYSLDGLRVLADERTDGIAELLASAACVGGCPHLNSGGFELALVRQVLDRGVHLDAVATYLETAKKFGGDHAKLDELLARARSSA